MWKLNIVKENDLTWKVSAVILSTGEIKLGVREKFDDGEAATVAYAQLDPDEADGVARTLQEMAHKARQTFKKQTKGNT